eukprot:12130170-Prorocentrum_lima.AAC.1
MTSSLVGSEMCIRDRDKLSEVVLVLGCAAAQVNIARASKSACTTSAGPVSYTHLTLPTICSV